MDIQKKANRLLQKYRWELINNGFPIGLVDPEVKLTGGTSNIGTCIISKRGSGTAKITLNKLLLECPEKEIAETIIHELLHTIKGAQNHKKTWKYWADKANKHFGMDIQRITKLDNRTVLKSLIDEKRTEKIKYTVACNGCGTISNYTRETKLIKTGGKYYRCSLCKSAGDWEITKINVDK